MVHSLPRAALAVLSIQACGDDESAREASSGTTSSTSGAGAAGGGGSGAQGGGGGSGAVGGGGSGGAAGNGGVGGAGGVGGNGGTGGIGGTGGTGGIGGVGGIGGMGNTGPLVAAWARQFGDAASQRAWAVGFDGAGNVLLAGEMSGSADFGGGLLVSSGGNDAFLLKLTADGAHVWSKRWGDGANQVGDAVVADPAGNLVFAGWFQGTIDLGGGPLVSAGGADQFVAKLDAAGNHLWSKRFGDAQDQYSGRLALDPTGAILLVGPFQGTIDFGGGPLVGAGDFDIYVAKLDSNGNHAWSKRFGATGPDFGSHVATNASGDVFFTGYFQDTIDVDGDVLTSAGDYDGFAARFDGAGQKIWTRAFPGPAKQFVNSLAVDASDGVLLAGHFEASIDLGGPVLVSGGSFDVFMAKLDGTGAHVWSWATGDAGDQRTFGLGADAAGAPIAAGYFGGTLDFGGGPLSSAGGNDVFFARRDAAGAYQQAARFGDAAGQHARDIAVAPSGATLIAGYFDGALDFGVDPLSGAGSDDIFIVKLVPGP